MYHCGIWKCFPVSWFSNSKTLSNYFRAKYLFGIRLVGNPSVPDLSLQMDLSKLTVFWFVSPVLLWWKAVSIIAFIMFGSDMCTFSGTEWIPRSYFPCVSNTGTVHTFLVIATRLLMVISHYKVLQVDPVFKLSFSLFKSLHSPPYVVYELRSDLRSDTSFHFALQLFIITTLNMSNLCPISTCHWYFYVVFSEILPVVLLLEGVAWGNDTGTKQSEGIVSLAHQVITKNKAS